MATDEQNGSGSPGADHRLTRIESLQEQERELARESGRFADLCSYLSQRNVDIPKNILDDLGRLAKLDVPQRTIRLRALNEDLMKFLSDLGLGSSTAH